MEILSSPQIESKLGSNERVNERIKKIKKVEELIQSFLIDKFGDKYHRNMKLTASRGSFIVDGLVVKNEKIKYIIEIRYITEKSFQNLKYLIIKFREKLARILGVKKRIIMLVVSDSMTLEQATSMWLENKGLADLYFFQLIDDSLKEIHLGDKNNFTKNDSN